MMVRRGKLFTVVFVVLVGGLFALEMFVLQGTCVFDERIELREGAKVEIRLDRVGEPHLIEFYTRRERRLKGTMTAPDGSEVWSLDEWADHKSHYVSFTPEVAGTYVLEAQRGFLLGGSSRGVALLDSVTQRVSHVPRQQRPSVAARRRCGGELDLVVRVLDGVVGGQLLRI